ncbi:MAG: glycine zipper 2TM domain-containing protein [Pseudomonadales bacterium]|nr:glycine zipper 2TM domain-containing protein [Pseudomonadales bacterium]MCC6528750.1 glycine zipper 2TM domain-containing protein [Pseudomonadales bacterium]MCP5332243.1 glycine zipper 2TM domain-containing protein [Pseudomonadales bacterium]HMU91211.1 RT0821/Lpp0805 family surface protein [Pseudomonadales bacterium]HMW14234.1 RT0821/Lpp0805 family surface protein [Pseudomonadales bacterium]
MHKGKMTMIMALTTTLGLGGCASQQGQQQQAGTVIGGVLGGVLGSQVGGGDGRTAAIIAGSLAGAMIGGAVGKSMDDTDRLRTTQALENSRTGSASSWRNPDSGNSYRVTPTRTYESSGGPCRDYVMEAQINGRPEQVHGTACRDANGTWVNQ